MNRRPKLKRHKIAALRIPGVYVLFMARKPVYVGQSQDVEQRIRDHAWPTHATRHAYRGGFDEYAIIRRPDLKARLALEKYLIALYRPIGNRAEWPARTRFLSMVSDPIFAPTVHPQVLEEESENAVN